MYEPQDIQPYWKELPRAHPYRQDMEKWEKPYRFEAYPRMVYMARKRPDGVVGVIETVDRLCVERDIPSNAIPVGAAEQWSRQNYRTVNDEDEYLKAYGQGWRATIPEALALFHGEQTRIADEAAHRNYLDRNLSESAKAEAAAFEGEDSAHVPEIPEAPRRGPGRPRKVTQ